MSDLEIIETGSGGDMTLKGGSFGVVTGVENVPYLSMFGFPKAAGGWWANSLFFPNEPKTSYTEQALKDEVLTSAGRLAIDRAANKDIDKGLEAYAPFDKTISVILTAANKIDIDIAAAGQLLGFRWNPDTQTISTR